MHTISVRTTRRCEIIDITQPVREYLKKNAFGSGLLVVYSPHTTAGISVNENADPAVKKDMSSFLDHLVPQDGSFSHAEGNSDAHIKGTLAGFSQTFIVEDGQLQLGTWQGIFFMEFDGPRSREVWLTFIARK